MNKIVLMFCLVISTGLVKVEAAEDEIIENRVVYITDEEYATRVSSTNGESLEKILSDLAERRLLSQNQMLMSVTFETSGYHQIADLVKDYEVCFDTAGSYCETYEHYVTVDLYVTPYGATITDVLGHGVDVPYGVNGFQWSTSSKSINSWNIYTVSATISGDCIMNIPAGNVIWKSGVTTGVSKAFYGNTFNSDYRI